MRLAVCLLTCGRETHTAFTLKTFAMFADRAGLIKLHADEPGHLPTNRLMAEDDGFELINATRRPGILPAMRMLWLEAVRRGASHILHLENDQEFTGAIPIFHEPECTRLYGAEKMRLGGPRSKSGPFIMGTKTPIDWKPWREGWERARAHWGGQASVTRAEILVKAVQEVETLKALCLLLNNVDTVRPLRNITWHTCEETTAGGIF